jgi:hypothetical protein
MRRWLLAAVLAAGCAAVPDAPAPGTGRVFGELRLVPREGVKPGGHGSASYGDRRMSDVEFVDYSRPGFAVVYVVEEDLPGGELELTIRAARVGTRIEPALSAVGAGGRVLVRNESEAEHVLSYPAAGVIRRLEPGGRTEFAVPRAGEQGLFLLDVPEAGATLFAAPGPFAVASDSGRFALPNLRPGPRELRVWHPRFPPAAQAVDLAPDTSVRVDLELGVGREGHAHAH